MAEDGSLDFAALTHLVEFHIDNGTDAIVAVGTTGESATLDPDEHCEVVRRVVEQVRGRIPVIAGTGANSTSEAIHLTREAMEAGADACLLVTPYYNKPTQEGLYQHFKKIADSVAIPQILYNVPGRTACDIKADTVNRLADIPNIVGIKEASTLDRIKELVQLCADRIDIYSGDDPIVVETILNGPLPRLPAAWR
jgi:4-hydroxy-tetrahydrodipicolinate synthase